MIMGKVLYKYCTSTFPISTFYHYIYVYYVVEHIEYNLCNYHVEINSIQ